MATRLRPSLKDRVAGSGRTNTKLISDEATDKAVDISTGGSTTSTLSTAQSDGNVPNTRIIIQYHFMDIQLSSKTFVHSSDMMLVFRTDHIFSPLVCYDC